MQIGNQCWFAENLRTELYRNGDSIPANLSDLDWISTNEGARSIYGEGTSECFAQEPHLNACEETYSLEQFGSLYNWHAVNDIRKVCPSGWHVPDNTEWTEVFELFGGLNAAGLHLKSSLGWGTPFLGTNSSGFSGLSSGYRTFATGDFADVGGNGIWWSSTAASSVAFSALLWGGDGVTWEGADFNFGFSVRCIEDTE